MDYWSQFRNTTTPHLGDEDDLSLWETALNYIFREATFLARCAAETTLIAASFGCCSRWLRPHQTRWKADGGFAWPSGYGGAGYSRKGQPEHDWTEEFFWNVRDQLWCPNEPDIPNLNQHLLRVTVPARTARHQQAAIPAIWTNGAPVLPYKDLFQIYGFRKQADGWKCTATNDSGAEHYELAADFPANKFG